ncbi:MAG: HemY protein [Halothiobacillaceae bacterium]|nr:MAG: HemY protein [Halothiobacillaceae bacterium]
MRLLVLAIVVLVGAIFLGIEIQKDPGSVVIQIRGMEIQASVALMAVAMLVGFVAFYLLVRVGLSILHMPRSLSKYRKHRARQALNKGMAELAQGHWIKAQKLLNKASNCEETATLGYLGSAQAAQQLGNNSHRDRYLKLAQQSDSESSIVVGVTEAQILIANQQLDQAARLLNQLYRDDPKNTLILRLLKECYLESHAWEDLAALMPELEKRGVVSKSEAIHLERDIYAQVLAKAAHTGNDSRALDTAWKEVPFELRRDKQTLALYVRYLLEHGEGARPEVILRNKIRQEWDDDLVLLYGTVDGGSPPQQLASAERWIKRHSDSAALYLTLGRLALRNHLWSKARTYLERSIELDARPETYMLLGKLLEQTGDNAIAGECFRKGLGITVGSPSGARTDRNQVARFPSLSPPLGCHFCR